MSQIRSMYLDRAAIGLSGLCIVHCVLSVVLVATMTGASSLLADPIIHKVGLVGAIVLGAVALGQGYRRHRATRPLVVGGGGLVLMALGLVVPHGLPEVIVTIVGVTVLALAHLMNVRASA
jgi:hypothetical protein